MSETVFLRLLSPDDKTPALVDAISALRNGQPNSLAYVVDPASFRQIPGSPFAYWVSERIRRLFTELPSFANEKRIVGVGLQTNDDFRFVRAWWEVASENLARGAVHTLPDEFRQQTFSGRYWIPFAKGGASSPYYADPSLVVNWKQDGEEMKAWIEETGSQWSRRIFNTDLYFRAGFSWALRTHRFSPYVIPKGCIFSVSRYQAFVDEDDQDWILGVLNGMPATILLRMCSERFEHPKFISGIVAKYNQVKI